MLDNSVYVFGYQPDNGIPISSWFDDKSDTELKSIIPYLRSLAQQDDVRQSIHSKYQLREKIRAFTFPTACPVLNKHKTTS